MNTINKNFVAIDVEYADREQNICQIGLAIVKDLHIVESRSWLIQPPDNHYDENYLWTHHVRPEDTADAGSFDQVWQEVQPYLVTGELWAHNAASTEMPVLKKNLDRCCYDHSWLDIRDSRDLYQRPGCQLNSGNGLVQCCMALGLPHDNHHDAASDAEMCAKIVIAAAEGKQPCWDSVPLTSESMRKAEQGKRVLRMGEFADYYNNTPSGEEDVFAALSSTYEGAPEQVVDVFDKGDQMPKEKDGIVDFARLKMGEGSALAGKKVVITGAFAINRKEIERAVAAMGGKKVSNPTKNTDAIIIGPVNVSGNKLTALEEQEAKGHPIARIVGDADLEELLYGDGQKFFAE